MAYHDIPDLSREALVELANASTFREGKALEAEGGVTAVDWAQPQLTAEVKEGGQRYAVWMDLRSMTFVKVRCGCREGHAGRVCKHAMAACIGLRRKATAAQAAVQVMPPAQVPPQSAARAAASGSAPGRSPEAKDGVALRSFRETAEGERLRVRLILPPNFEAAAQRDAIMVKVECVVGRQLTAPERLSRATPYRIEARDRAVIERLEAWAGDRLHGLLQLKGWQLLELYGLWGAGALVYAGQSADAPLTEGEWAQAYAPKLKAKSTEAVAGQRVAIRRSRGVVAQAPARRPQTPSVEHPDKWMVIDGSPHYLAILLREREHPLYLSTVEMLRGQGFHKEPSNGKWWLRDRHKVLNFLALKRAEIDRIYDPGYTANFAARMGQLAAVEIAARVDSGAGGSQLHLQLTGKGLDDGMIRQSMASGRHYVVNGDDIHLIPPQVVERYQTAVRALTGDPQRGITGAFAARVRPEAFVDTEAILEELEMEVPLPEDWVQRSAAIKHVGQLPTPPLPEGFKGRLRGYQLLGVAWLWHLWRSELGGVLGDEMGLGKTIQAIGLLECLAQSGGLAGGALIVAPASLLTNWAHELSVWAPQLQCRLHHGLQRTREAIAPEADEVWITSYSTLRNDSALFLENRFAVVIADEAQHIKNRRTHAARALRQLAAGARFVLTGTPIENSVADLRSLFEFCLPGYLGRVPAGLKGEDRTWIEQRMVSKAAPYILRRSKRQVAPELPDKIEQVVWCEMGGRQRAAYVEMQRACERALLDLEVGGASDNRLRFAVLTELLRLRQICADPGLVDGEYPLEDSCKLAAFAEIMEEAVDGGHRILVFSQFVQLLKRLAGWLEAQSYRYSYIDGSTRDRLGVCREFNADAAITVCLISLKAGGTGLNLTGADTVVHFDPWWNPAVEDQATDRAHRIGQTRTVSSYKLITVGTVEDKVMALQAKKAELLRSLLDESAMATAKVELADLRALLS